MSVLVYIEHAGGAFKKSTYELLTYGRHLAAAMGKEMKVLAIGNVAESELTSLGKYGVTNLMHASDAKLNDYNAGAYSSVLAQATDAAAADVVILSNTFSGKGMAPRAAAKLKAAYIDNVIELADTSSGFRVKKNAFSGKGFAFLNVKSSRKVLAIVANSYKVEAKDSTVSISAFNADLPENLFNSKVREVKRATDKIALPDAELVVSAGRGLKGPENWGMVEELAELLGAATACSKPVSDADWRPHAEHVGQTGIAISPNLYIAIGISGAIQHLAGVSSSKTIVVINKDPEAPFFKAADYGIVGDAFEVVPKMIEAVKKLKAHSA